MAEKKKKPKAKPTKKPSGLKIKREEGEYSGSDKVTKKGHTIHIGNPHDTFVTSWKIGDTDYGDGQTFNWRAKVNKKWRAYHSGWTKPQKGKKDGWRKEDVGKTATSKTLTLNRSVLYPNTNAKLYDFQFRVKGNRKKYQKTIKKKGKKDKTVTVNPPVSKWSDIYGLRILKPLKPTIGVALNNDYWYICDFSWNMPNTENNWATNIWCQTGLAKGKKGTVKKWYSIALGDVNPTASNWPARLWTDTATKTAHTGDRYYNRDSEDLYIWNGSSWSVTENDSIVVSDESTQYSGVVTVKENTALFVNPGDTYTRYFRAKSFGPAGSSDWVTKEHVYGIPNQAKVSGSAKVNNSGGITVTVNWSDLVVDKKNPLDSIEIQYCMGVPATGMNAPVAGSSWSDLPASKFPANSSGSVVRDIDASLADNQCLFVRINTVHDSITTNGVPKRFSGAGQHLAQPTVSNISPNNTTYRVSMDLTNNASEVADSYLVVYYKDTKRSKGLAIGKFTSSSGNFTVQCPKWDSSSSYSIGVKALVANSSYTTSRSYGTTDPVYLYSFDNVIMGSNGIDWTEGDVPKAPTNVTVVQASSPEDTAIVTWDWPWADAQYSEISWATSEESWMSTDEPNSYRIQNIHSAKWYIVGLDPGIKWYIKVRLIKATENGETYSDWSESKTLTLSSVPDTPILSVNNSIVTNTSSSECTLAWDYSSYDGSNPKSATFQYAKYIEGSALSYSALKVTCSNEEIITGRKTIKPSSFNWTSGSIYYIRMKISSEAGRTSEWSEPIAITIVPELTIGITLSNSQFKISNGVRYLRALPTDVTVTGAGTENLTRLYIIRTKDYFLDRPDENTSYGYNGEIVYFDSHVGQAPFTITSASIDGALDDGAEYKLYATISDNYGQSKTKEIPFTVGWTHQAVYPTAEVELDQENMIALITPQQPSSGFASGDSFSSDDRCDIYRLSIDKPRLIVEGAEMGTTYVDPYPTYGDYGGYRIVYVTDNGDYIIGTNQIAATDYGGYDDNSMFGEYVIDTPYNSIDFPDGGIDLMYNITLSNSWTKDFQQTRYLGGSIQGDWNEGVERKGSITAVVPVDEDPALLESIRRLADYAGICHVRTIDGSSYPADVQVTENWSYDSYDIVSYTLNITRVDDESLDGMTLAEWNTLNNPT